MRLSNRPPGKSFGVERKESVAQTVLHWSTSDNLTNDKNAIQIKKDSWHFILWNVKWRRIHLGWSCHWVITRYYLSIIHGQNLRNAHTSLTSDWLLSSAKMNWDPDGLSLKSGLSPSQWSLENLLLTWGRLDKYFSLLILFALLIQQESITALFKGPSSTNPFSFSSVFGRFINIGIPIRKCSGMDG